MKLDFEWFKKQINSLAKKAKIGHKVPDANTLFTLWEKGWTPHQVVQKIKES